MHKYDFLAWLINKSPSLSTLDFTETQFKVQQVKWNRHRRHVPYTIYNGVIFDWVVGNVFPVEWPFEDDEKDKDVFCLELSSVIGSPEFLHHLLSKANKFLSSDAAVPPFGLGFLLSCESKFRGELGPSDLLDMLLGDMMFGQLGDKGAGNSAAVKDLYRDWRQRQEHELNSKEADITDAKVNLNRKRLKSSSDPAFDDDRDSDSSLQSKPPYKRLRRNTSPAPPAVKQRSGLLQWLSSTTTRFKPDVSLNAHNIKVKEKGSPEQQHTNEDQSSDPGSSSFLFKHRVDHEDPPGWICVKPASSTASSDPQSIPTQGLLEQDVGPGSPSPDIMLPEIPLLSSFHFPSYALMTQVTEEVKTLCVKNSHLVDSSNTVSSTSKSSSFPSLIVTSDEAFDSVEQGSDSLNNAQAQLGDNSDVKYNKSASEALDIAEVDALLLSSSNLSCSTAEVIQNGEESLDAAEVDGLLMTFNTTAASNSFDRLSLTSTQASQSVNISNTSTHLSFFTASPSNSSSSVLSSPLS
ncbi:hypothetical protein C8J55DRAFT_565535 [Lentinula edodes]|uniref:Uncharacterized protein n=1 Tax=Lentinula lateritia TaxID=40482 RepID=A0A9W9DEY5_9AGAR|nr:hypothetical protein C8J55DRAFT_565535 [Lentinula edodes]